ncbi:uncharacterized protein JCM15063_003688 [Sporobolomyces koalae]|uniref:uncharacterized protein n=1 Tax=Sporobolomyces koalae TaxID=500713 RepID=UPI0031763F5A
MPLPLSVYVTSIDFALKRKDGPGLATLLRLYGSATSPSQLLLDSLDGPDKGSKRQDRVIGPPDYIPSYAAQFGRGLKKEWAEIATHHVLAMVALNPPINPVTPQLAYVRDPVRAVQEQHQLVNALYRFLINSKDPNTGWCLEVLYRVCEDLRRVAHEADARLVQLQQKPGKLEEASRLLQKCFSCCLNDRSAEWIMSRKMGTYYLATLLFKTYINLNSTALCKNIIRGIQAAELPALEKYPQAHQVAFGYYMGVFAFMREDYKEAEKQFKNCLKGIHKNALQNICLILDYLIPLLLLRGVFPSKQLYQLSPKHSLLYKPFAEAIKSGDITKYDRHLGHVEKSLMDRGSWLIVERAREVCVRGLLKKMWILEGRPSRISIQTFRNYHNAAVCIGSGPANIAGLTEYDSEEMECLLANYINKGLIKGYISHSHQLVVLSREKPFPKYAPF